MGVHLNCLRDLWYTPCLSSIKIKALQVMKLFGIATRVSMNRLNRTQWITL